MKGPLVKSEHEILELIAAIYRDIGGDPSELVSVRPSHGGWLNALRFEIVRADNAMTWLSRTDIDSANRRGLTKALKAFAQHRQFKGSASRTPSGPEQRKWRGRSQDAAVETHGSRLPEARKHEESSHSPRLLLLCGNCSADRQHAITIDEQSVRNVVVIARCDACGATIQLALTGGSKPGRTIADRLKRAIRFSTRHGATSPHK